MVARARPGVLVRALDHASPYGITLDVADYGQQMRIVLYRKGVEAFLEEVAAYARAKVDSAGVAPMGFADGSGQGGFLRGDEDTMDVVRHQTPGPHVHVVLGGEVGQQAEVGVSIGIVRKKRHRPDPTLDDVVGQLGQDDTRQVGHGWVIPDERNGSISLGYPVPGIPEGSGVRASDWGSPLFSIRGPRE